MQQSIRMGMSPAKSRFVYSGLRDRKERGNEERPQPIEPKHEKEEQDSIIRLLFVGRYDRQKGLDLLLDAFRQYPELQQHIQLYIIGDSVLKRMSGPLRTI